MIDNRSISSAVLTPKPFAYISGQLTGDGVRVYPPLVPRKGRNQLCIMAPDVDIWLIRPAMRLTFPHAIFWRSARYNTFPMFKIIEDAARHAKKSGTLDELIIHTHGDPKHLGLSSTGSLTSLFTFFDVIAETQKAHDVQIASRIMFLACNVFTNLSHNDVGFFRSRSQALNMEIVGATTIAATGLLPGYVARFVQFKDGNVARDRRDQRFNPATRFINEWGSTREGFSSSWVKDHVGRTQEEGKALQIQREARERAKAQKKKWYRLKR